MERRKKEGTERKIVDGVWNGIRWDCGFGLINLIIHHKDMEELRDST
jgi:hypothetical protein